MLVVDLELFSAVAPIFHFVQQDSPAKGDQLDVSKSCTIGEINKKDGNLNSPFVVGLVAEGPVSS